MTWKIRTPPAPHSPMLSHLIMPVRPSNASTERMAEISASRSMMRLPLSSTEATKAIAAAISITES